MSKWKLTLEHTDGDGCQSTVSCENCFGAPGDAPEMLIIANDLAAILTAFEHLGRTVPCAGENVLNTIIDQIHENYSYWEDDESV